MKKNAWFKHYNDAHDTLPFKNMLADKRHDLIVLYWMILELVSQFEDRESNPGMLRISTKLLGKLTHKNARGLPPCLEQLSTYFTPNFTYKFDDKFTYIFVANWLKFQEHRGGKREAKRDQTGDRYKNKEDKSKDIRLPSLVFDFESLYENYPRKEGREAGFRKLKAAIKTQEDFDQVKQAILRYRDYLQKNGTEKKYIKHFSTFMNSWRDCLEPSFGASEDFSKKPDAIPDWIKKAMESQAS